jgi:hypothetical protein
MQGSISPHLPCPTRSSCYHSSTLPFWHRSFALFYAAPSFPRPRNGALQLGRLKAPGPTPLVMHHRPSRSALPRWKLVPFTEAALCSSSTPASELHSRQPQFFFLRARGPRMWAFKPCAPFLLMPSFCCASGYSCARQTAGFSIHSCFARSWTVWYWTK